MRRLPRGRRGLAEVAAISVMSLVFTRVARALRPVEVSASALLLVGLAWFAMRLRG